MLASITLNNFQSHKDTTIELDKRVTAIVGASHHGKTSILRALQWIIKNKPQGTGFIRHGKSNCSVSVVMNGKRFDRVRSSKANQYLLDGEALNAIGTGVPEEVDTMFSLEEHNIQSQFESSFLIFDSPGKIAAYFNRMSNITNGEETIKAISKEVRATDSQIALCKDANDEAKKSLENLFWLDGANDKWYNASKLEKNLQEKRTSLARITELLARQESVPEVPITTKHCSDLENKIQSLTSKKTLRDRISSLLLFRDVCNVPPQLLALDVLSKQIAAFEEKKVMSNLLRRLLIPRKVFDIPSVPDVTKHREAKRIRSLIAILENPTTVSIKSELQEAISGLDAIMKEAKVCPLCEKPL